MSDEHRRDGPEDAATVVLLGAGAGAGMDHPFLAAVAQGMAATGLLVLRFEFPYMAGRRVDGKRRPPDREAVLLDTWRQAVRDSHPDRMRARGLPDEALKLAEQRLVDINRAWEEIQTREAA